MTPENQRIKIAEACGWKRGKDAVIGRETWPVWHKGPFVVSLHTQTMADYLNDLNAMHEAEKVLDTLDRFPNPRLVYYDHLREVCHSPNATNCWSATATQRAEAFLRTLNLWKDDQ
jgi:hypothetical protein